MNRRTFLLGAGAVGAAGLGAGVLVSACTAAAPDVPAMMAPLPAAPETVPPARIRPVSHWTGVFESSWDYQGETGAPMSRSGDSWDHYNLSYSLDACVAMFRATGERRYLDRALELTENVVASAVPSASLARGGFRDRYRGWASTMNGEDGDEVPLYESYFWRYGAGLLAAMRDDPKVYADNGYRARYDRLLTFAEVNVFEKWFSRGAPDYVYRDRTHLAAHWALIALHLGRLTADAGRRARYQDVVAGIDRRLRGQMRRNPVEPTAYFWSDVWGSAQRPGQDVSHGNAVMAYTTEARDHGPAWTAADLTAFSALLTKVVWPSGRTYRAYVDGTGEDNGWFSDGFVKLGRSSPAVQIRLEDHRVVNDQFAANMALNARLLLTRTETPR